MNGFYPIGDDGGSAAHILQCFQDGFEDKAAEDFPQELEAQMQCRRILLEAGSDAMLFSDCAQKWEVASSSALWSSIDSGILVCDK